MIFYLFKCYPYFSFYFFYYSTMPHLCFPYFCTGNPLLSCHQTPIHSFNMTFPYLLGFLQMLLGQKVQVCSGSKKLDYFFLGSNISSSLNCHLHVLNFLKSLCHLLNQLLSPHLSGGFSIFPFIHFYLISITILMLNYRPIENFQV